MSEPLSLPEQVIYKLGQLEASLESGFKRIDERLERLTTDHRAIDDKLNKHHERITLLEAWVNATKARTAMIVGVCGVAVPAAISILVKVI